MNKIGVYSWRDGREEFCVPLPNVFLSPIRIDILKFVNSNMSKNKRQAYSVNQSAGMNTSSISWGTGRAVARVPRVKGSGSNRSGQGAVANSCRGGRMFSPTTIWRKWHHKIIKTQRSYALSTAIACSGLTSIVIARGHNINKVPEIPLVLSSLAECHISTKSAKKTLINLGAYKDIVDKKIKRTIKAGKGKFRNRRYKNYLGPLIIHKDRIRNFRNMPGIDTSCVKHLSLQKMAPGGHVGRFCIWTVNAFRMIDSLFSKKMIHAMTDLKTIINSEYVQNRLKYSSKSIIY